MAMMRQMRAQTALLTAALLLAGLSACSGKKTEVAPPASASKAPPEDFFSIDDISGGLQTAPDEFSVLTKKPLELPERFDVLPAPEPGKLSSRDPNPLAEAQQVLLPKSATAATANATTTLTAPSAAERVALSAAGEVDPNIRQTVAAEQAAYDSEQRLYILDRYFPILPRLRGETITGTLDPVEERKRLVEEGVLAQPLPDTPETGAAAPGVTETAVIEYVPVEPTVPAPVAPAPYIVEQTPYIIETAPAAQPSAPVSDVPTFGGPVQSSPAEVESNTGLIYIE